MSNVYAHRFSSNQLFCSNIYIYCIYTRYIEVLLLKKDAAWVKRPAMWSVWRGCLIRTQTTSCSASSAVKVMLFDQEIFWHTHKAILKLIITLLVPLGLFPIVSLSLIYTCLSPEEESLSLMCLLCWTLINSPDPFGPLCYYFLIWTSWLFHLVKGWWLSHWITFTHREAPPQVCVKETVSKKTKWTSPTRITVQKEMKQGQRTKI